MSIRTKLTQVYLFLKFAGIGEYKSFFLPESNPLADANLATLIFSASWRTSRYRGTGFRR